MLKFLNPWWIIAFILALGGATGYGIHLGKSMEQAARAKEMTLEQRIQVTLAIEVSKIHVTNTTLRQTIEGKTRESIVYRDCRAGDDVVGLLNSVLTGKAAAPAAHDLIVPTPNAAHGQ